MALIKPALAFAGQTVCRESLRIMVDSVYAGAAHSEDRMGRALPDWQGCLTIQEDEVFLMNPNAPASFWTPLSTAQMDRATGS